MTTIVNPSIEEDLIPLCELEEQSDAVVQVAELDDEERQLLASLGLREEDTFTLCRQGSPCIVQVEATRLGLSKDVTSRIMVRRCDECSRS